MSAQKPQRPRPGPHFVDHAISALSAWFGDHLERTGNELHQPMAFFQDNRPVEPQALGPPPQGKLCVLVHGLGCNEGLWSFPSPHPTTDYGALLADEYGYLPLYVRYNTGLRVSLNGRAFAALMERYCSRHVGAVREIALIGHSMGGLVIRSACHLGEQAKQSWVPRVRQVFYLGSPHLGAPLEKLTHVATNVLGLFDTTATRVVREVLDTRAAGIKDLRFGSLVDEDWLDREQDARLKGERLPVPWLATARHYRVVGQVGAPAAAWLGDAVVREASATGVAQGQQPGAPRTADARVMPGLDHLALARHPDVYAHISQALRAPMGGDID